MTIGETIQELHGALREYIEAAYHISNPELVAQRREMLDALGVIHQRPYLESTPRYRQGQKFADLGLDPATLEMFSVASTPKDGRSALIYDPPYQHQADAVRHILAAHRSIMVMTGTGSGKTECFLLPILGKLAREAKHRGKGFGQSPAIRAMVLYPMNALVNDQLGRLRLLFGDQRIVSKFMQWSGRPARFARYTSRTLYPGVREETKDKLRLDPIGKYYVKMLEASQGEPGPEREAAAQLVTALQERGKWPAKEDLAKWYGKKGTRWTDAEGRFKRCVTQPGDPELLTRHEVHDAPPDVLVTNYSMLEYMLMRPLERPVFDRTREWLRDNPNERFLLVIDEAHLYRGAGGAEVALLIRRLRMRLGIPPDRLQIICTSASFADSDEALRFGAQLSGKQSTDFEAVKGTLSLRANENVGSNADAAKLCEINLPRFYEADTEDKRLGEVSAFLDYRNVPKPWDLHRSLYEALEAFSPMAKLVNATMQEALPIDSLGTLLFPGMPNRDAAQAVTNLMALGSTARRTPTEAGLLPCRVHSFYRGLPGIWVCMDPKCSALPADRRSDVCGKMFSQPQDHCECGARVLELFTCRQCGTAYARAFTDDIDNPNFLWSEPGSVFVTKQGVVDSLQPIDLLLERPLENEGIEPADYDLLTGRVNPQGELGERVRQVFLRKGRVAEGDEDPHEGTNIQGEFRPCAICKEPPKLGRSTVQDHQTKGDQPFQALISKQIQVQPPNAMPRTRLAPLRGRKVLIFSDSRQTAARLAPNIQKYSMQDVMRPLIAVGYDLFCRYPRIQRHLTLQDIYAAVLAAARLLDVRLRPELKPQESFSQEAVVEAAIEAGVLDREDDLDDLVMQCRGSRPPESLLRVIADTLSNRYYDLESLALASVIERPGHKAAVQALPDVPGIATTPDQKLALTRAWLRCWTKHGIWLPDMPGDWYPSEVGAASGKFTIMDRILKERNAKSVFEQSWRPKLLALFTEQMQPSKHRLKGTELSLMIGGAWAYCRSCRTTQRPFPGRTACMNCGVGQAMPIDPDNDPVFAARKDYYRSGTVAALRDRTKGPVALIAAEHTAQLNTAQAQDVYSKAEEYELLFQDVALGPDGTGRERPAIDVLSCTTTMEVGIDIGSLSGVALRNMPPARANYQQRAGRAGRRGNAIATVTTFGSADSHDEHYFTHPDLMIRGPVDDPTLTLSNRDIARRHVTAYLLQRYHQDRLPNIRPEDQKTLFAVLGKIAEFKSRRAILNRYDFEIWLREHEFKLKAEVSEWLPSELSQHDRDQMLAALIDDTLGPIDRAIDFDANAEPEPEPVPPAADDERDGQEPEVADEEGEEKPAHSPASDNLLDRLLYKGVLPRYAFPTDVASFHVFDESSSGFRPIFRYTPSQGLAAALSQYAPGKQVWIDNKLWTSKALYSPMRSETFKAWERRKLYYECQRCRYACTEPMQSDKRGDIKDCPACGVVGAFGPAAPWVRPAGFAHSFNLPPGTSPDDQPVRSYASRAKLTMPTPVEDERWTRVNDQLRVYGTREHLLVTNRGFQQDGFTYCARCGLIEPTAAPVSSFTGDHLKPYPDSRDQKCLGTATSRGIVLGTDFVSDVLLISLRVEEPLRLLPSLLATDVALRTVSEALTKAACIRLELEASELQAEYRPALNQAGWDGREAEIYLYDTLPGGAGFAQQVGGLGLGVFRDALRLLRECPANCDRSCYRCLRSYKNKFEHELLDRYVGASLLQFLLNRETPQLAPDRLERSTDLLFHDLQRQGLSDLQLQRNASIHMPDGRQVNVPILVTSRQGEEVVVGLHGPLTPELPPSDTFDQIKASLPHVRIELVDELLVRRNLPQATSGLIGKLT
jgi:ATP-dependent helicase YprA (DUF1998 family)